MSTPNSEIKPGNIVTGPTLPEPIEGLATVPMGESLKVIGRGRNTGMTHDPVLAPAQLAQLTVSADREPLITFGSAPLEDPIFRSALFEQLGSNELEVPVTTDIAGKKDAHAVRLDREASNEIKKASLHRKVASAIFFESNGG